MNAVDSLVKEFLIYRGFTNTLKQLDNELKADKDRSFRADKIVDYIVQCIATQDLQSLLDLFNHLNCNVFSKLEQTFAGSVKKLQYGVYKLYLVHSHNNSKPEKITEFFTKLASELQGVSEWKDWFVFPFCKAPEEQSAFSLYFTKQWQDTLLLSLHNFLATIFQCMPQPALVRSEAEVVLIKRLQDENALLRSRLQQTNNGAIPRSQESKHIQNINDIIPIDISPPPHIVDDFYIIAQETLNVVNAAESQTKGLKSLIKNISAGGSPVMGRKDGGNDKKRRSGSVSRNNKD